MLPQTSWGHIFTQGVGVAMALNAVLFARLIIALSVAVAGDNSTEQGDPDGLVKCLEPPNSTWMTVCTCRCCLAWTSCANQSGGECFDTLVSCITTACRENADDCKAYVSTVHKACNEKCGMDFWCPVQCFAKFQQDRKNCENMKPL